MALHLSWHRQRHSHQPALACLHTAALTETWLPSPTRSDHLPPPFPQYQVTYHFPRTTNQHHLFPYFSNLTLLRRNSLKKGQSANFIFSQLARPQTVLLFTTSSSFSYAQTPCHEHYITCFGFLQRCSDNSDQNPLDSQMAVGIPKSTSLLDPLRISYPLPSRGSQPQALGPHSIYVRLLTSQLTWTCNSTSH